MSTNRLFKRTSTGAIQQWDIEVQDNRYRTISGQVGGALITHEWTTCEGKNLGRANETSPGLQALNEAAAEHKRKVKDGYFLSIDDIDTSVLIKPMLAKVWEDRKDKVKFPVYVQPKLDGMRLNIKDGVMLSRTGELVRSAPHILREIKPVLDANPGFIPDGELYSHAHHDNFQHMMHLARQQNPGLEELAESEKYLEYWVYDRADGADKFSVRTTQLFNLIGNLVKVRYVQTLIARNEAALEAIMDDYLRMGYEGAIIRLDAPYEHKRSDKLLKYKKFQDEEFEIVRIAEGIGDRSGMAGAIEVVDHGRYFSAGLRGDVDYYRMLWKNRESYVGKKATVRYFGKSQDNIPRFPVVTDIDRRD